MAEISLGTFNFSPNQIFFIFLPSVCVFEVFGPPTDTAPLDGASYCIYLQTPHFTVREEETAIKNEEVKKNIFWR